MNSVKVAPQTPRKEAFTEAPAPQLAAVARMKRNPSFSIRDR